MSFNIDKIEYTEEKEKGYNITFKYYSIYLIYSGYIEIKVYCNRFDHIDFEDLKGLRNNKRLSLKGNKKEYYVFKKFLIGMTYTNRIEYVKNLYNSMNSINKFNL